MNRNIAALASALLAVLATVMVPATVSAHPSIPGSTSGDGLIWVPSAGIGSIQGIDPVTKQVVKTVQGAADHPVVIKANADGTLLFTNSFGPLIWEVSVTDVRTGQIIKRIPTFGNAWAVTAMSHDHKYLYVPTSLSAVQVIDTSTLETVRVIPVLFPPGGPIHLEVAKDNKSFYAMHLAGFITKYDAVTGAPLAPPLWGYGIGPGWGGLSENGDTLYAINLFSGVTAIDTAGWYVKRVQFSGLVSGPVSATLTPDGERLWVCNWGDNLILVYDAHTMELIHKVKSNGLPIYAGFSADGKTAYVSNLGPSSDKIPDYLFPAKLAQVVYPILNPEGSTLDFYDTETMTITDQVTVNNGPIAGVYPR